MSSKKTSITHVAKPASASRGRKQFDALATRLQAANSLLAAWNKARMEILEIGMGEFVPLQQVNEERLKQLVLLLDRQHAQAELDDVERERLSSYIAGTTLDLLDEDDDPDLEQIYVRHGGEVEEEDAMYQAEFREVMQEIFDMAIDADIDMRTPEGRAVVRAMMADDEDDDDDDDDDDERGAPGRSVVALSNAELERARHLEQVRVTADAMFRSMQGLYTGLGTDGQTRQAREELMQQADAARALGNLPDLLAIRFELEQRGMVAHLSEKQLAECNKLLKEALRQIELQVSQAVREAKTALPETPLMRVTPEFAVSKMKTDLGELRQQVAQVEHYLKEFQDPARLKAWLQQPDDPKHP